MGVALVRAAGEVGQREHRVIGVDGQLEADRSEEAGFAARRLGDARGVGHAQWRGDAGQLLRLDGVQFVIAADQQRDRAAVCAFDQQRLDDAAGGQPEDRR